LTEIEKNDAQIVNNILQLHQDMVFLIEKCFDSNPKIKIVLSAAFEQFMNVKGSKVAEIYVKYFDKILKSNSTQELLVQTQATRAHMIFKYIQAKDVFKLSYNQRLSKRLFMQKHPLNVSNEKFILAIFQRECGEEYVRMSDSILDDYEKSIHSLQIYNQETSMGYNPLPHSQEWQKIEFSVNVIANEYWPFNQEFSTLTNLGWPFNEITLSYEKHYQRQERSHILSWQNDCSNCELVGHFISGAYTFQVSTIQAMVLMVFNQLPKISMTKLSNLLKISNKVE
jgi:hypothetical protein